MSSLLVLSGCWTFRETDYPQCAMAKAAASARTVALSGFKATEIAYEAVSGWRMVYVPGYCGRRDFACGHYETIPSVDYVPQPRETDRFLRRAQDAFESSGFVLGAGGADRTVEVTYDGPYSEPGDAWRSLGWMVGTLLFCVDDSVRWTARLRIRDAHTGRLLYHRDYDQSYEVGVFGLIPLFGAASSGQASMPHMQNWCLSALTDRACADAADFLSNEP